MPGQLRSRKRRSSPQSTRPSRSTSSTKACAGQSSCVRVTVDSAAGVGHRSKACMEQSGISCECEQSSVHRRCTASPQPLPRHDKENQQEAACCGELMDYQDYSKLFPDEDSNQVLPVEHFFGNMDTVQDFPQRPPAPSTSVPRAQRRRRYFALEESDGDDEREGEATGRREESEERDEH